MPSLTLTLDAANATRVANAIGFKMNLGRAATVDEIKSYIITRLKAGVLDAERTQAQLAANSTEPDIN